MPRISGAQRGEGVQAVVFALQILEYLAQHRSTVGVTDLARVFDTTKSRMHRHLQTLVAAGYVMREEETERYRSGARLIAFGRAVARELRADQCGASRDGEPARLARPRGGAVAARARRHAGDRHHRGQVGVRDRREARLDARAARDRAGQAAARLRRRRRDRARAGKVAAAQHALYASPIARRCAPRSSRSGARAGRSRRTSRSSG